MGLFINKIILHCKELGATELIDPSKTKDVVADIEKVCCNNEGTTYAIDYTGVLRVIQQCIERLAPCGTAVTVGLPPPNAKVSIDPLMFLLDK